MNKEEIIEAVNQKIISNLEKGVIPWKSGFNSRLPQNFISKHFYRGINSFILRGNQFPSNFYLTFLQCRQKNGKINSGEKGSLIVFYKILEYHRTNNKEETETLSIPYLQYSHVFNLSQTDLTDETPSIYSILPDEIINNLKHKPIFKYNTEACYFDLTDDFISLPPIDFYKDQNQYYSNFFHELIHWTGNENRLNRFSKQDNRDKKKYALEELVAELGASYLCCLCGIEQTLENESAYIEGWLKELNNDKNLIFRASSLANKAIDYLITINNNSGEKQHDN